mgnify:CR=1 FL=1
MALFPCLECGRQISDKADACPQCGYPVARLREESTAQETIALTVHLPVITCNYDKGYSLFRIYAQMEHRDVYATFFGGPAAPASIAIRDENENPLPFGNLSKTPCSSSVI